MNQPDDIARKLKNVVCLNGLWLIGLSVTPQIWRNNVKSSFCDRTNLMPPSVPAFRKPMTQDDKIASTLFSNMHFDAVCLNEAMIYGLHHFSSMSSS
jgi:hypothetical protein